jgi:hypothetical protein
LNSKGKSEFGRIFVAKGLQFIIKDKNEAFENLLPNLTFSTQDAPSFPLN